MIEIKNISDYKNFLESMSGLYTNDNFISNFLHDYLDKLNDEQWLDFYKDYNRSFNY